MPAFAAVFLILAGETLSIAGEFIASRTQPQALELTLHSYIVPLGLITLGGLALLVGYVLGYHVLRNIWIISAVSIGSILIVEPILALLMFDQLPTHGAAIGFALGVIGAIAAIK